MRVKNLMVLGKLCLILVCSNSYAQSWEGSSHRDWSRSDNLLGLGYNVARYFSAKLDKLDVAYHSRAVIFALNNVDTGDVVEWYNDQNASHGKVRISATWTGSGNTCRQVQSYVITGRNSFTYSDRACYNSNINTWIFVDK